MPRDTKIDRTKFKRPLSIEQLEYIRVTREIQEHTLRLIAIERKMQSVPVTIDWKEEGF